MAIDRTTLKMRAAAAIASGLSPPWLIFATVVFGAIMTSIGFVDRPLALYFATIDPDLHQTFKFINRFGVSTPYLVVSVIAFLAFRFWRRHDGHATSSLFVFAAVAVPGLISVFLKMLFGRMRPKLLLQHDHYGFDFFAVHPDWASFPSGHATTAAGLALALALIWPRYRLGFAVGGAAIVFGRIVVNAHFLSDALAGAALGVAGTAFLWVLLRGGLPARLVVEGAGAIRSARPSVGGGAGT